MNKIIPLLALACSTLTLPASGSQAADKPNIIFIMADDLGYGDLGCYGQKLIRTPNIDRLAEEGVRFTQGYVTASVCGPSRYGLLMGMYQQRIGVQLQSTSLLPDLTVLEQVQLFARLYGRQPGSDEIVTLLKQVGLAMKTAVLPDKLSGGQQQRCAHVDPLYVGNPRQLGTPAASGMPLRFE